MSGSRGGPRDWDRSESRDVEAGTGRFEFPEDGEHWTTIWTGGVRLQSLTPSEGDSLTIAAALALGGWEVGAAGVNAGRFGEAIDDNDAPFFNLAALVYYTRIFRRHVGFAGRSAGHVEAVRSRVEGRAVAPIRDAEGVRGMRRRGERDGDEEGGSGARHRS